MRMTIPTDLIELSSTSSSSCLLRQIIDFDSLYLQRGKFSATQLCLSLSLAKCCCGKEILRDRRPDRTIRRGSTRERNKNFYHLLFVFDGANQITEWTLNCHLIEVLIHRQGTRWIRWRRLRELHLSNLSKDDDYVQMGCGRSLSVLGSIHSPCLLYH